MLSEKNGYDWPKYSDFCYTIASALGYVAIDNLARLILPPLFICFCNTPDPGEARNIQVDKMAQYTIKSMYYIGSTYWNLHVSFGKPWLPKSLGGAGTETHFAHDPYSPNQELRMYLLVTMGYHLASLIITAFKYKSTDFFEMMLHHVCTIYLYGGSYMLN